MAIGWNSIALLVLLCLGLAACGGPQATGADDRGIKWVQPEGYPVFYYIRQDAKDIGTYNGLYVAPIIADPAIAGENARRQQTVAKIVAYFHAAVVAALNRDPDRGAVGTGRPNGRQHGACGAGPNFVVGLG